MTAPIPADTTTILVRHPTIVVCIPAYNEERFLASTVASLQAQTWTDFAALICDNASADRTAEIAREIVAADRRFHYHRHPSNIGGTGNFNFGREATESPYLMWLGGHDQIAPTFLEKTIGALNADSRVSLAAAYTCWIDEHDDVFRITHGWMDKVPNIPVLRYVLEPKKNDLCSEINNVIRRERLDGFRFDQSWGTDNVALAQLAYRGLIHYVPEPLYRRRELGHRGENYMKRMSGKDLGEERREQLIDALDRQLTKIAPADPLRPLASVLMRWWLQHRYGTRRSRLLAAAERLKATVPFGPARNRT